jgi:hypothetical protein
MQIINNILKERLLQNKCYKERYNYKKQLHFEELIGEYNYLKEYNFYFIIGFKYYYFLDKVVKNNQRFKPDYNYIIYDNY